jgi:hypothetical protein
MTYDVYDSRKEWEYFDFPLEISNISFENNLHKLNGEHCAVVISRDENFKLKATIKGHTLNPKDFKQENREDGPGNFAALDTITGYDNKKNRYTLINCVIGSFTFELVYYEKLGMPFTAVLHFDSFLKKPDSIQPAENPTTIRYEWFVSASVNFFYPGTTRRFFKDGYHKLRDGIDEGINSLRIIPNSSSRDYFTVNVPGVIKCIVSEVPKRCKLKWAECFCIEYRSSFGPEVDKTAKKSLEYFLSFLFGTELIRIGSTTLSGDELILQEAFSPSCGDVIHFCQNGSKPPIRFNEQYEWGKIQHLVDKYFPVYLKLDQDLDLEGILWRFFQARTVPVGVNLPILSSAMEKLCRNYLKSHNEIKLDYLDEAAFLSMVEPEIELIKQKLAGVENADIIINKFKAAYKRGDNERLQLFFSLLDLPVNKLERKALKERNSMAHGGSDAKTMDKAIKLILHSRVYETLFHRVFLRVLGYDEYYIDYYLSGTKVRKITTPTGPKEEPS